MQIANDVSFHMSKEQFLTYMELLFIGLLRIGNGIFFLVILRAHDESSGNITTLGVRERYDCQEWARWVVSRVGEDVPIFLMGLSFDGAIALMSRDLDFPNSVSGIIDS